VFGHGMAHGVHLDSLEHTGASVDTGLNIVAHNGNIELYRAYSQRVKITNLTSGAFNIT
jgi:hypothetical protein